VTFTRRHILAITAASPLAAVVACAPGDAAGGGDAQQAASAPPVSVNHQVKIEGFVFEPASLSVKMGDSITFTNLDIVPHTATAKDRSWDTGNLAKDEAATITVEADMVTDYFCAYHPNMVGALSLT